MALVFYPHEDDLATSTLPEKLEALMESAQRYKAAMLDMKTKKMATGAIDLGKRSIPKDLEISFNWGELAIVFNKTCHLTEVTAVNKAAKVEALTKLKEIYEALHSAGLLKLEIVISKIKTDIIQLSGNTNQITSETPASTPAPRHNRLF